MKVAQVVCACLCATAVVAGFQNCSQNEFTMIDPAAKNDKVAGQSVFGGGEGVVGVVGGPGRGNVGAVGQNGGGGNNGGNNGNTTPNNGTDGTSTNGGGGGSTSTQPEIPISHICSTRDTNGVTVAGASTLRVKVAKSQAEERLKIPGYFEELYQYMKAGTEGNLEKALKHWAKVGTLLQNSPLPPPTVVCEFESSTLRKQILEKKTFPLSLLEANCGFLSNGTYVLSGLHDPKHMGIDLSQKGPPMGRENGGWGPAYETDHIRVLERLAQEKGFPGMVLPPPTKLDTMKVYADLNPEIGSKQLSKIECDSKASPLVIHMHADVEKAEPLVLSSPRDGVWFDILGRNADPKPYTPKRISWHRSDQYYYIALPNSRGEVRGIDQLFGNNTFGPDGRFAPDGFAALAKYDGMSADGLRRLQDADGYITDADAVYSKLRLWQDLNFDGVAQASELKSLKEAGIAVIDLNFDPNYREVDKYGNETRYKSVVQDTSGRLHLLFDIWFKLGETPSRLGLASER